MFDCYYYDHTLSLSLSLSLSHPTPLYTVRSSPHCLLFANTHIYIFLLLQISYCPFACHDMQLSLFTSQCANFNNNSYNISTIYLYLRSLRSRTQTCAVTMGEKMVLSLHFSLGFIDNQVTVLL